MKRPSFAALKPPKLNKTWLVLGIAIVIGLLAAWIARSYLVTRIGEIESQSRSKNINLVVAKADLPKGSVLSSDNLAVRAVPVDYGHSNAVLPEHFDRIEGQTLAFSVKAGELILWPLLEGKKAPTFSARVETGRRAITVAVDEINSISGMLEPGDLIDLMVSFERNGRKKSVLLMQGVKVLATGQRSADDPKSGERRMYSTVTLDTDPPQAQQVVLAREIGRITALMRNPADVPTQAAPLADLATLVNAPEPIASAPTQGPREVPVLYGGTGGRLPADGLRLNRATPQEQNTLAQLAHLATAAGLIPATPNPPATTAPTPAPAPVPAGSTSSTSLSSSAGNPR